MLTDTERTAIQEHARQAELRTAEMKAELKRLFDAKYGGDLEVATESYAQTKWPNFSPDDTPARIVERINIKTSKQWAYMRGLATLPFGDADRAKLYAEMRNRVLEFHAIAPSVVNDFEKVDPPEIGLPRILAWCKQAMGTEPLPQATPGKPTETLIIRSDTARRLKISFSAVTRFVKDRPTLRENGDRGSRIYFERFKSEWEAKYSAACREQEIRARTVKQVNQDARGGSGTSRQTAGNGYSWKSSRAVKNVVVASLSAVPSATASVITSISFSSMLSVSMPFISRNGRAATAPIRLLPSTKP